MDKDCNWDPVFLEFAPKPTKAQAYFCSYDGTGNLTVFMTGNDFAVRQLAGVKKALSKVYKKSYFAARHICLIFMQIFRCILIFFNIFLTCCNSLNKI